jgi:hypothetical protein
MTLQTPLFNRHVCDTTLVESETGGERRVVEGAEQSHTIGGSQQWLACFEGVLSMKCELESWVRVPVSILSYGWWER